MTSLNNRIQSLVFDIQLAPREKAHSLQNTISRLYTYRLEGLLQQFFDRVIPPGLVVKADTLTLDLGNILYEQVENELPEKLLAALEKAFDVSFTAGGGMASGLPVQYTIATTESGYLELLVFFLRTGSFPWWGGIILAEQLEDYIELLGRKQPRRLREVLMAEGKREQVRRRIAWQFSEATIKHLIQVLEPEECFFILAYHKSITRQQQQYNLVKSGTEDFKRAVWLFILSFLLAERETWFNRKVFIKSTLRQMAAHFNVPYNSLIALLYQALYAAGVDIEQARLTWFIKVVLEEELQLRNEITQTTATANGSSSYDLAAEPVLEWAVNRAAGTEGTLQLKNILAYFLETGIMPAFTQYTPGSLSALLQQLLVQQPQQALQLLQWAGMDAKRMNRMLYQFAPEVLIAILHLLPAGEAAIEAGWHVIQLTASQPVVALPAFTSVNAPRTLVRMVWSYYMEMDYRRFHAGSFYIQGLKLLYHLPGYAWFTLLPEMATLFQRGDVAGLQYIAALIATMDERGYIAGTLQVPRKEWKQTVLQLPEIKKILLSFPGQELLHLPLYPVFYDAGGNTIAIVEEALGYFLMWNRLPDYLLIADEAGQEGLLADMVLYLFEKDRTRLRSLLQVPMNAYAAKRNIYRLFQPQSGGKEALVANWLAGFIQADIAVYLGDAPFIAGNSYYKDAWKAFSLGRVAVLLSRYYGTATIIPPDEQVLLKQALALLDFFFTRNSLPPGLPVQGEEGMLLLQYLFRWVLGKNSNSLGSLLQKNGHQAAARIRIHNWFGTNEFVNGKSITAFTATWLQHDVMAYLQQAVQEDITETAAWLRLVSWQQLPVGVIKYAAVHFSTATLQKWLQRYNSAWFNRVQPAIELLQRLFKHFTALTRNWPQLQLNEFLLLAFAAHIEVKDAPAFIQRFFAFTDKHIPPPVYKVYEHIARAWAIAREREAPEAAVLARLVDREIQARLIQRLPVAQVTPVAAMAQPETGYAFQPPAPEEALEKIYVQNAGLVLLYPFLALFFSRLNLTEKGKFVNEEAQFRAVHLLQYLADGLFEHEEPLLPLPKLLIGMPLNHPLPPGITPLPEETELAAELFKAVFQQWEKMKNATVDGFRQSFLIRNGLLARKEDHWVLRVERRGYDLLLQTIPWSYGTVRLPWMKEMLYVEWEN